MLGDSSSAVLGGGGGGGGGNSSDAVTPTVVAAAAAGTSPHDGGESTAAGAAAGPNSGEQDMRGRGEERDRSFGGKRWPRQETLALLKMRSDMDVAFRDASVKGPLWEEVSRKMAEHGYHRSAKKCKEKFENVYKYHKRTKDGRTGKSEGKTYRFFDQLEPLDHHNHPPLLTVQSSSSQPPQAPPSKPPSQLLAIPATPISVVATTPLSSTNVNHPSHLSTVPSTITPQPNVLTSPINPTSSIINNPPSYNIFQPPAPPPTSIANPIQSSFPADLLSNSPSSSTSSDESIERRQRRKRKWKDFFGRLTKEVIEKQEQMQKRLLEAIEKQEHERMVREETWRMQEMARINREREILAQEISIAAAKDAAVMALLQKITEQQNLGLALNNINISPPPPPPPLTAQPVPAPTPAPAHPGAQLQPTSVTNMEIVANDNNNYNGENLMTPSSARWPKVEVQALIKLRTSMDEKYQENGPKGPLWEEISAAMRRLGYNRNAKRCKEKWENINKYFKKAKESNKKRPQDAKTCPYFHQLDALYREKNKLEKINSPPPPSSATTTNHNLNTADNNSTIPTSAPLMVQPEQQWHPQQEENNNNNAELEEEEEDMDEEKDIEDEDDEGEEEEGGSNYEIVVSQPASVRAAE